MINSTPESIVSLRLDVEKILGFDITCTRDCEVLADEMMRHDRRFSLSVSTLRRFFDLIKSKNPPSLTTLNSLARYTGSTSFKKWDVDRHHQNDDIVNSIVENDLASIDSSPEAITKSIASLELLLGLFEKSPGFKTSSKKIKEVQKLSIFLFRLEAFPENIWIRANRNPQTRLFVEAYPPIDYMSAFGKTLMQDYLMTADSTQDRLFSKSIIATGLIYTGIIYSIALDSVPEIMGIDTSIHPMPQARVLGQNLLALKHNVKTKTNQSKSFRKLIIQGIKSENNIWPRWSNFHCNFKFKIAEWIILSEDIELLSILNDAFKIHRNDQELYYRSNSDDCTLDLYRAWCLYILGDKESAMSVIENIENLKFLPHEERSMSMYYYSLVTKLNLNSKTYVKIEDKNKSSLNSLDLLTNQTKYIGLRKMLDSIG
jgi:hypothetical protein